MDSAVLQSTNIYMSLGEAPVPHGPWHEVVIGESHGHMSGNAVGRSILIRMATGLLAAAPYWQNLFVGSLILLAVTSDVLSRGRRRAR